MPAARPPTTEYLCPGAAQPVSRAIHLGRLARFDRACRQCPHRHDAGTLSRRQVTRLEETEHRGRPVELFGEEGIRGVVHNEIGPQSARRLAVAFAAWLRRLESGGVGPVIVLGGDGRPETADLLAAASQGIRWTGCHVVDVGRVTSPCLVRAIDHLGAEAGMLVGNPDDRPGRCGIKLWAPGPLPISAGATLNAIRKLASSPIDRPTRAFGRWRHFCAEDVYLGDLVEHYHAMRPLRVLVHTPVESVLRHLEKLTEPVACRAIRVDGPVERLPDRIRGENAHFAAVVGDDGERCRVWDERGRPIEPERLFLLAVRQELAEHPGAAVVLGEELSDHARCRIRQWQGKWVASPTSRGEIAATMVRRRARLGGDAAGRVYSSTTGAPAADALAVITFLLAHLSRSDRPLSQVLDEALGAG